jgi:hypothetical protein
VVKHFQEKIPKQAHVWREIWNAETGKDKKCKVCSKEKGVFSKEKRSHDETTTGIGT